MAYLRLYHQVFSYEEAVQVSSVHPLLVSLTGGTRVTLRGSGFSPRGIVRCRFGPGNDQDSNSPTSYAFVISPVETVCVALSLEIDVVEPSERAVQVYLAVGDAEFEPSGFWVTYLPQMIINSVEPTTVDETGGHSITIHGRNFPDVPALACRFAGREVVPALWVSLNVVRCMTPTLPQGAVVLELTFNGVEFVPSRWMLTVLTKMTVTGIYPELGPINGGTQVTVTGTGFSVIDETTR